MREPESTGVTIKGGDSLTLAEVIDRQAFQEMMEDFHRLTNIASAVFDISGEVLVAAGFKDICRKFHRVHPETLKNCRESDPLFPAEFPAGSFKHFLCGNNLRVMSTPIEVDGRRLGNISFEQFFYDDENVDRELFRNQARKYGFDEAEYLAALDRVPRIDRKTMDTASRLYARLAGMISGLSHDRQTLARILSQKEGAIRRLAENEDRQRAILQTAMDGFWMTDLKGRLLEVNDSYCRMTGYSEAELLSMRITDLDAVKTREEIAAHAQRILEHGHDRFETRHRHRDGSVFDVELSVQYQPGMGGRMVAFLRDITDRKRAEEEKITLETQLLNAQKIEAIGALAGGIAHDFNNILFPIIGRCEMLRDDESVDGEVKRHILNILKSARRASDLVRQILAFSRQSETGRKPVKLQKIIGEVLNLIRHSIPSTIEIILAIDETCDLVNADASQIHQVLMNLIANAYHAMEDAGGRLEIGLTEIQAGSDNTSVKTLPSGRYVDMFVTDTGAGMEEGFLQRIFDPYFTTKEIGKGTGLGLAVSYGIVKKHGGAIHVTSTPGEGSTFHVYLPVIDIGFPEQAPDLEVVVRGGSEHLLFVDDEFDVIDTAVPLLEQLGYRVTARTGSVDALETFRSDPDRFDIMVTDMTMPDMTGVELAGEIHKIRPDFPVVLCTGFSSQVDEDNAREMGMSAFVMKPIVRDQLAIAIRRIMDE